MVCNKWFDASICKWYQTSQQKGCNISCYWQGHNWIYCLIGKIYLRGQRSVESHIWLRKIQSGKYWLCLDIQSYYFINWGSTWEIVPSNSAMRSAQRRHKSTAHQCSRSTRASVQSISLLISLNKSWNTGCPKSTQRWLTKICWCAGRAESLPCAQIQSDIFWRCVWVLSRATINLKENGVVAFALYCTFIHVRSDENESSLSSSGHPKFDFSVHRIPIYLADNV